MTWINFPYYISIILLLWIIALGFLLFSYKKLKLISIANGLFLIGWIVLIYFIINLWIQLDRPPIGFTTSGPLLDHFPL